MKYIKLIVATLSFIALFSIGTVSASPVSNVRVDVTSSFVGDACSALSSTVSSTGCSKTGNGNLEDLARNVVNIMSIAVGIIAVIMIIVAGFRFITAGGNSNSVGGAKNTLIYAVIGIFIAVLAQLLVHLVLNTANNVKTGSYLNNNSVIRRDA